MALIVEDGKFVLREAADSQVYSGELATAGTYVDRNIKIEITADDGALSAGVETKAGSASMAETGFTKSSTATGHYVTLSTTPGSATGSATVVADGWVDSADNKDSTAAAVAVTGNGNRVYIPDGAVDVVATNTSSGSVAVSGAATGFTAASSATDYYVTLNGTATNGSIKATATVSATGMVDSGDTFESNAVSVTPGVTGSGNKIYIPKASVDAAVDSLVVPTVAVNGTAAGFTASASETAYSVNISGQGTSGSVKAKATNGAGAVGMIAANVSDTSAASAIVPTITGSGSKVYIPEGKLGAGVEGNITFTPKAQTSMATITKPSTGTDGADYFSITASGTKSGTVTGKANVATEGYVKAETASGGSVNGIVGDNATLYVAKAVLGSSGTVSGTVSTQPGDVTVTNSGTQLTGKTKINVLPTAQSSSVSGDFYIPIKATVAANTTGTAGTVSGTVTSTVNTAGYAPATLTGTGTVRGSVTATTTAKESPDYFIGINKTAYFNGLPSGMNESQFTDISSSAPALVSGGYLYIREGYNVNQKISLAKLVPDNASIVAGASDNIVSGQTAYDNDGKLITGSLSENSQAGALVTETSMASGYSYYRVTTDVGYNKVARTTDIPVYQGTMVTA